MNGFLLIDKPIGITSFDVIRNLRNILQIKKIGHTGTLDPLASGCLFLAVGNYTKLIPYFEQDSKVYDFEISLNGTSPSFDLGTEVSYISEEKQINYAKMLTIDKIDRVIQENFSGYISQLPPKYSALKIGGKKAVDLIRAGKDFDLKKRTIQIFSIYIKEYNYPYLSLVAHVSSGTYIRSIASDLGELLGTGGHITKLRRTKIENFSIEQAIPLESVTENDFLDVRSIFPRDRYIELDSDVKEKMDNGLTVAGEFDFPIDVDLFVCNACDITNIVIYDGKNLRAKRKIL